MRIIAGKFKSRQIQAPRKLPARPTTDRTKEALFNMLNNYLDWENIRALDLFSGTGNITLECISRGATEVVSVDKHAGSIRFLQKIVKEWGVSDASTTHCMEVKKFLTQQTDPFDLIFLDPPYAMPRQHELLSLIFQKQLLTPEGVMVLEHRSGVDFSAISHFQFTRIYGDSSLSFFFSD